MGEFATHLAIEVDAAMSGKCVCFFILVLACVEGFEPPTTRVEIGDSIQLSYTQIVTEPRKNGDRCK